MESLVIVESGAKASKIKGYLDANFKNEEWHVAACLGHIRDLLGTQISRVRGRFLELLCVYSILGTYIRTY